MALKPISDPRETVAVTIVNGSSLSPEVDLGGYRLAAIAMPAGWDAAGITFQGTLDGATYLNVYDDAGTELALTAAASHAIALRTIQADNLRPFRALKIRSGTSGVAVNQTADRVLTLILVPASV